MPDVPDIPSLFNMSLSELAFQFYTSKMRTRAEIKKWNLAMHRLAPYLQDKLMEAIQIYNTVSRKLKSKRKNRDDLSLFLLMLKSLSLTVLERRKFKCEHELCLCSGCLYDIVIHEVTFFGFFEEDLDNDADENLSDTCLIYTDTDDDDE
jgi:hypothetical protein